MNGNPISPTVPAVLNFKDRRTGLMIRMMQYEPFVA